MTFVLVFFTTLAVAFLIILGMFRGRSAAGGVFTSLSSGFSNVTGSLLAKSPVRSAAIIITLIVLFFFWDELKGGFAGWLASSDAGTTLGFKASVIEKWLWVVVVAAVILFIFWRVPNPIWAQLISAVVAVIALIVIAVSLVTGETIFSLVDGSAAGRHSSLPCATMDDFRAGNSHMTKAGRPIAICASTKTLYVFSKPGQELSFSFSKRFAQNNAEALEERTVGDFVRIQPPGTWHNPAPASPAYKLDLVPSGWEETGWKDIELYVRGS